MKRTLDDNRTFKIPAELSLKVLKEAIEIIEEWEGRHGAMATDLAISLFNLFQSDRSPDMD
jgi:hypothetical protein